jgi:hypothetical protein
MMAIPITTIGTLVQRADRRSFAPEPDIASDDTSSSAAGICETELRSGADGIAPPVPIAPHPDRGVYRKPYPS